MAFIYDIVFMVLYDPIGVKRGEFLSANILDTLLRDDFQMQMLIPQKLMEICLNCDLFNFKSIYMHSY